MYVIVNFTNFRGKVMSVVNLKDSDTMVLHALGKLACGRSFCFGVEAKVRNVNGDIFLGVKVGGFMFVLMGFIYIYMVYRYLEWRRKVHSVISCLPTTKGKMRLHY